MTKSWTVKVKGKEHIITYTPHYFIRKADITLDGEPVEVNNLSQDSFRQLISIGNEKYYIVVHGFTPHLLADGESLDSKKKVKNKRVKSKNKRIRRYTSYDEYLVVAGILFQLPCLNVAESVCVNVGELYFPLILIICIATVINCVIIRKYYKRRFVKTALCILVDFLSCSLAMFVMVSSR